MDYLEQLLTEEWKQKREIILQRDKFYCQNCFNKSFDNHLRRGFAMTNFIRNERNVNYFVFANVNSTINNFPRVFIRITNSLLISKFNKIPNIFWIEYFDNLEKFEADICFIRRIPLDKLQIIKSILRETKKNATNPIINNDPFSFYLNPLNDEMNYPGLVVEDLNINDDPIENQINPYYNPILISIGKELPICFAPKLNVHHKVYREKRLAWEYHDDDLVTLCWTCHESIHKNAKIQRFSESGEFKGLLTPCHRCFGAGWFPQYSHVENGICFRCRGHRYEELFNSENIGY